MRKDIIAMSKKEIRRIPIIHRAMEKRLTQVKAAEMLDLSDRHHQTQNQNQKQSQYFFSFLLPPD
ncbi:MAG: hypothetical protein U9R38_05020, partial [Candidatus Margulisiibacteriota bacterium]|nr:hypothetical protein [Candidatus Margulisiibacteriota bacterium]